MIKETVITAKTFSQIKIDKVLKLIEINKCNENKSCYFKHR